MVNEPFAHRAHGPRPDHRLRTAVIDDVCRLRGSEVGIDQRVVQTAAPRRPHHRVDMFVVLQDGGDGVAFPQAHFAEVVSQLIRPPLQLAETDDRARWMQNQSRFCGLRVLADLHGRILRVCGHQRGQSQTLRTDFRLFLALVSKMV